MKDIHDLYKFFKHQVASGKLSGVNEETGEVYVVSSITLFHLTNQPHFTASIDICELRAGGVEHLVRTADATVEMEADGIRLSFDEERFTQPFEMLSQYGLSFERLGVKQWLYPDLVDDAFSGMDLNMENHE